jgi:hypothetical protein
VTKEKIDVFSSGKMIECLCGHLLDPVGFELWKNEIHCGHHVARVKKEAPLGLSPIFEKLRVLRKCGAYGRRRDF